MEKREVAACQAGNIQFVKWMDNKPVHMLSNFLSAYPLTAGKQQKKGSKNKLEVSCLDIVKCYNEHTEGVDLMDQKRLCTKSNHRSSHKYYLLLVYDFTDPGVNNACVVYNKMQYASEEQLDGKSFRRAVACTLIRNFSSRKQLPSLQQLPLQTERTLCQLYQATTR